LLVSFIGGNGEGGRSESQNAVVTEDKVNVSREVVAKRVARRNKINSDHKVSYRWAYQVSDTHRLTPRQSGLVSSQIL
jgi:uncharacterized membrane protein YcjF (UPF0283 family)